jgi:hypothetical protein
MLRLLKCRLALATTVAVLALPIAFFVCVFTASPASAAQGDCVALVGGVNLARASTPSRAIHVKAHSTIAVEGVNHGLQAIRGIRSVAPLQRYQVQMQFYLLSSRISWTVASGDTSLASWANTVDVDKYAKHGTGLYLVHAIAYEVQGERPCAVDGFVNVIPSGLSDVEIGGLVLGGLGIAAAAGAGLVAAQEGRKLSDVDQLAAEASQDDEIAQREHLRTCLLMSVLAVPLTFGALLAELARTVVRHINGGFS